MMRVECQHGSLKRQCEICQRDDRIAELEEFITATPILQIDAGIARARGEAEAVTYARMVKEWRERGRALGLCK